MKTPYNLGSFAGFEITANRSIFPSISFLWLASGFFSYYFLNLDLNQAIAFGLSSSIIHWLSELWHQIGHGKTAQSTGYPMKGILFWGLISTSIYPENEPNLPAKTHIRRALGGPSASLLLGILFAVVLFIFKPGRTFITYLSWFGFIDNLIILGLGSLMPLGFTDGSTLLKYWGQR